jgi:DNA polymerase-3 subunit epsilon
LINKRDTRIIVFDLETNGLHAGCSVLSCSAIKYDLNHDTYEMKEINRFNRYHYPIEEFNYTATYYNGLTRDVITEKRGDSTYPENFSADHDFEKFCSDTESFVAHNISFDIQFVPFIGNKNILCTMMTNMDIVAVYFLESKREWKWPKLSETAIHYGIQFSDRDIHSSIADAEITAKIFMKMLEAIKADRDGVTTEIEDSHHNLDPFYNFTWQLKNVNVNVVSQCKLGDILNLIREHGIDSAVDYLGVATKSGEYLGDIDSSDVQYYGLIHRIDHGAKTSVKIKQIFTTNGNFESINIKVFIGSADWENQKTLHVIDREAKGIITKAKTLEKTNPEEAVSLYRKAMEMLKGIDHQCEKHFSTWRGQKFPINRLSLVLERQQRYEECLQEIEAYEKSTDKLGLYAGEKEILEKRKEKMLKAIKKYPANSKTRDVKNRDDNEIKPHQDAITINENQEDSDLQRFLKEDGLFFTLNEPHYDAYVGMSVNLWIPKVKNPDEVRIYPRNGPDRLGVVYSDTIIDHLKTDMGYDARIIELTSNTCKIKCRLISKEENELRKEEYKTSLIREMKKPYRPKKPIALEIATKKKKAVKAGDKVIIEFEDLDSYGYYPKFNFPWHIKFLNKAGYTIGIFADDRNIIQRLLKTHFNSYHLDVEVLHIAEERSNYWKGYPIKLVITPIKIK